MNEEFCSSCKCIISVDQQAFIYKADIVCKQCYQKLTAPKQTAPAAPVQQNIPQTPKEAKVQPPAASASPTAQKPPVRPPVKAPAAAQPAVRPKKLEKKLSKVLYLYSLVGGLILAVAFICLGAFMSKSPIRPTPVQLSFYLVGLVLFLYCIYVTLSFYYNIFKAIADSKKATSPAKAIGFLFIPIFNIYWIFYVLVGFAEDYNSYIAKYAIGAKKLSTNLFFVHAFCMLFTCFLAMIPVGVALALFAGMGNYKEIAIAGAIMTAVFGTLTFGLHAFVINKLCDAVNALIE